MNNEPVVWKAYEEVHFNDQYILRWVREGDEYVNKITKEMMEDLKSVVRQQQAKIAEQERTIKGNRIHIRQLELVTYWLVENRPEVWEDIRKWAENERN